MWLFPNTPLLRRFHLSSHSYLRNFSYNRRMSFLLSILLYSQATTYAPLYTHLGTNNDAMVGRSVAHISDFDGDGISDYAYSEHGSQYMGKVHIVSGATGNDLTVYTGSSTNDFFGSAIADAGDLDNDGLSDVIIGATGAGTSGKVYVYSQNTQLFAFDGSSISGSIGEAVANASDVNNDGVPDILASSPDNYSFSSGNYGRVVVWSGANGAILHQIDQSGQTMFGTSLAGLGDIDNDGYGDFAASAPYFSLAGIINGKVEAFSGATGNPIFMKANFNGVSYGSTIANLGDVNNDGINDLGCADHNFNSGSTGQGEFRVVSGATGIDLYDIYGSTGDYLGFSLSSAGDLNNDGHSEFMAGAPQFGTSSQDGYVQIYDGATGALLDTITMPSDIKFGSNICELGDVNNDGSPEVVCAARWSDQSPLTLAGSCYVFSDYVAPPPTGVLRAVGSAGGNMHLGIYQMNPLANCRIGYSLAGLNAAGNIITSLAQSIPTPTDTLGIWQGAVYVPAGLSGTSIWIQGIDLGISAPTNVVFLVL